MPEPLWLEEVAVELPVWEPAPPGARLACDVLVIGAGLAGTSAALALQARGVDVLVVERDGPGRGASGRNAGFVLLAHVFELPALRRRAGAEAVGALLALARRNHALLRERFAAAADHRSSGSLMLSMADDPDEAAALEAAAALLRESGAEVTLGDPHPALRGFGRQLALREDGQLHPGRLLAAMAGRVRRGVRGRVEALAGDRRARLEGGGEIRFSRALVATNAHVAELVPALRGVVTPERAQILATEPLGARVLEPVAYANWGYDYFRQRDDGVLLVGGRRHLFAARESTAVAEPSDEVQRALDAYLEAHLPFARGARVTHRWAGTMGFSPDELPLMGPAPGFAGDAVHVLAGFTGHGLGLAPVLGELWAEAATGRASEADRRSARLFDPARPRAA
jgi:glycine/D-amino acid oxidase-like deaminating enzyme